MLNLSSNLQRRFHDNAVIPSLDLRLVCFSFTKITRSFGVTVFVVVVVGVVFFSRPAMKRP